MACPINNSNRSCVGNSKLSEGTVNYLIQMNENRKGNDQCLKYPLNSITIFKDFETLWNSFWNVKQSIRFFYEISFPMGSVLAEFIV